MGVCSSDENPSKSGSHAPKTKQNRKEQAGGAPDESQEMKRQRMLAAAEARIKAQKNKGRGKAKRKSQDDGRDEYGLMPEATPNMQRGPSDWEKANAEALGTSVFSTKPKDS